MTKAIENVAVTRPLLYLLFFLSGAAGLVYQIVWTRMLVLVFGNTMLATATVLAAFMAGLAAGSYALGVYVDRRPRPLVKLYALLEIGVGLSALAFPLLLAAATPLYSISYRALEGDLVVLNLVRFAVCFGLISVPTFLMGGTLPVLLKRFAGSEGTIGTETGLLYGWNTGGAVAGTVASGYLLLRVLGMERTTWLAVTLNLAVAAVAWAMAGREPGAAREAPPAREVTPGAPVATRLHGPWTRRAVLLGIGLSGFCALAYEVFWTRMLNLFLHNTVYSFTAILATFLVGIAVGSLVYSQLLSRVRDQVPLFVGLEVGIGLAAYATPFLFGFLHGTLFHDLSGSLTLAKTMVIMFPPTVLMGIAVPMAVEICHRGDHREGTTLGRVYAVNTAGSIVGAFLAGFVLLPVLGLQKGVIVVASLNVLAGALPAAARARPALRPAWGAAAAVVVTGFVLLAPPHLFRSLFERSHPSAEILHYEEGRIANVVVYDFQRDGYKDLHLNAVEEASSRLWHVQLFKLLGILPPLLHEDPEDADALMIAFGAGMSAGAAVRQVSSLDCVDLNPDIEGVAEVFSRENLDVIHDPRFHKVVNDGRNALLTSRKEYPLIISDATNPKMFDSWTLYSREFYELVASRLAPGGVFAQWMLIPLPADSLQVTLNTFRSVFPHASLWCIYGSSQCLMLATPERLEIDYAVLKSRLEPVLGSSGLEEFGVGSVEKLLSFFLAGEDHLGDYLDGTTRVNTDDLPYAQFRLEQDAAGVEAALRLVRHREPILPYLTNTGEAPPLERTMATYGEIASRLHLGFLTGDATRYREAELVAADAHLDDANVRTMLHYGPEQKRYFEARVAHHPEDANAHNTLGYIRWQEGEREAAERSFRRALALDPSFALARANLARLHVDMGRLDEAAAELAELRELNPTRETLELTLRQAEIVHLLRKLRYRPDDVALRRELGAAYYRSGRLDRAVAAYRAALERAPNDAPTLRALGRVLEAHELVRGVQAGSTRQAGASEEAHPPACDRALVLWNEHRFDGTVERHRLAEAAALYEKAIAAAPGDLHAYVDAATLHEILGRHDKAMELWRGAARVRPEWPVPPLQVERLEALMRLESGRLEERERSELLARVGERLHTLGYRDEAVGYLERAIEAGAAGAPLWARLARALSDVGRYPEAEEAAERALALDPGLEAAARIREHAGRMVATSAEAPTGDGQSRGSVSTGTSPS